MGQEPSESQAIAATAAQLIVDESLDHASAKRKAARQLGLERSRHMPSNEQVEDEVRMHLAIFHADTHADELVAMRALALRFMQRLEAHASDLRPHVVGAVWRGTATQRSRVLIECFADDPKMAEIALLNLGLNNLAATQHDEVTLTQDVRDESLGTVVTVDVTVRDADALRGALKPDARGQTWRGTTAQLRALMAASVTPS